MDYLMQVANQKQQVQPWFFMSNWAVIGQNKLQSGPDVMPIITEMALWDVGVSKLFFVFLLKKFELAY